MVTLQVVCDSALALVQPTFTESTSLGTQAPTTPVAPPAKKRRVLNVQSSFMCLPADTLVFSERISHRPNKFSNFVSQALEQTIVQKESSFKESLSNVSAENAILGYSD